MKAAWPAAVNATEARDARRRQLSFNSDRDVAVDELALVDPILHAIFDPIPIVAEETYSFVRGRKGQSHATCTTPSIAHDLKVNPAVRGFPFWTEGKFNTRQSITSLIWPSSKEPVARTSRAIFSTVGQLARRYFFACSCVGNLVFKLQA
jgi:hypothetical protein